MPDPYFLDLPGVHQGGILAELERQLGHPAGVLEKDVWVCWTLDTLFGMPAPSHLPAGECFLAFKGGTSLSKVYGVIDRFSEDIDVTVNYRAFNDIDPFHVSKNQAKKHRERVETNHLPNLLERARAFMQARADRQFGSGYVVIEVANGTDLNVRYPTLDTSHHAPGYLLEYVKVEFGGRNAVEPSEKHPVTALAAAGRLEAPLRFPEAMVDVLALERTFWEKVTLAHFASTRSRRPASTERLSRHWFDLARLYDDPSYARLIAAHGVRDSVIEHKAHLFPPGNGVDYESCRKQQACLLPDADLCRLLRADYEDMLDAQLMSHATAPSFDHIVEAVRAIENDVTALS